MKTKFTKGEWTKNDSGADSKHYREFVIDVGQEIVAYVKGDTREEAEANAKLISAAPELLNTRYKFTACSRFAGASEPPERCFDEMILCYHFRCE